MGNYFVMSMRFNKSTAAQFGLLSKDESTAVDPKDGSLWKRTALYDFGWGKENGYYKMPLPGFDMLFKLALHSLEWEDMYGAAAIILENYTEELLCSCEALTKEHSRKKELKRAAELFRLKLPMNRSPVMQKTAAEIQRDDSRWKKLSGIANQL